MRGKKRLEDLALDELRDVSPEFSRDALALLSHASSVKRKRSRGSTGPREVEKALRAWRKKLGISHA